MFPNFYSSWNSKLRLQTWRFVFGIDASFPNFCSSWNSKLGLETWPMLCFEVKTIQIWNFVSDLLLQLTFSPSFPKQKPRLPNWTFFFSRIKASILEASSLSHNLVGNEASIPEMKEIFNEEMNGPNVLPYILQYENIWCIMSFS